MEGLQKETSAAKRASAAGAGAAPFTSHLRGHRFAQDQRLGVTALPMCQRNLDQATGWYIIDATWLKQWQTFANGNGPLPNEICNNGLLDELGKARPGLRAGLRHGKGCYFLDLHICLFLC